MSSFEQGTPKGSCQLTIDKMPEATARRVDSDATNRRMSVKELRSRGQRLASEIRTCVRGAKLAGRGM
jgi:hypothetical protein